MAGTGQQAERSVEERPIASYYSLTAKGEALCPVLDTLESWAEEWVEPRE